MSPGAGLRGRQNRREIINNRVNEKLADSSPPPPPRATSRQTPPPPTGASSALCPRAHNTHTTPLPTPDLASRHSSRHSTSRYLACQLVLDVSHSTCISLIRTAAQICVQLQITQVIYSAVQVPLEALGTQRAVYRTCPHT